MRRIIIIVLDSVGVGELPDADKYGDVGSNTLGNIVGSVKGFSLPNLESLGLGLIDGVEGLKAISPQGCFGRLAEKSAGKDTTTGHWEIAGVTLDKPFPVYPLGFPDKIIESFEAIIGTKTLGNYTASGTEIIKQLGRKHVMTGYPIVYTSADSVFQIAAHEGVIPVEDLYKMCLTARGILKGEHAVGRVIARPFTGAEGNYSRTDRRRDFSLKPMRRTVLDVLKDKGFKVKAVGKIEDIFAGEGVTDSVHIHGNMDGVDKTLAFMKEEFKGMIFTNLVDFDMLYGHRNDVEGYARALADFDRRMPEIMGNLGPDDILILTADHGCDPTTGSTDHSREYVPLLVYGRGIRQGVNLGTRSTFADIAETVSEMFETGEKFGGTSFYRDVILR